MTKECCSKIQQLEKLDDGWVGVEGWAGGWPVFVNNEDAIRFISINRKYGHYKSSILNFSSVCLYSVCMSVRMMSGFLFSKNNQAHCCLWSGIYSHSNSKNNQFVQCLTPPS